MIVGVLRRVLSSVVTIVCIYVVTFVMVILVPGNPLQSEHHNIPPEAAMALRARYNMDDNWDYFWQFLRGAIRLDFGPAFTYSDWTCNQIIATALPVSMLIGFLAILAAVAVGVPLGVFSARRRNRWADRAVLVTVLLGISLPSFVTGSALLIVFSVCLRLVPIGGWGSLLHLPLPVLALSLPFLAHITRLTRVAMIEALASDFVRTALAKGVAPRSVATKHALKVALLPVVSFLGPATAQAMTGSFVVEKVFGVPGIGQHFVNAALNRDAGLVLSTVLVYGTLVVGLNFLVDLLYMRLDPRITDAL